MNIEPAGQRYPRWMPTAGGVLSIISGSLWIIGSIFLLVFSDVIGSRVLRTFFPSSAWQH